MNANKRAFPCPQSTVRNEHGNLTYDVGSSGMTMRQWYKAAALTGIIFGAHASVDEAVMYASRCADAMLAEDEEHAKK